MQWSIEVNGEVTFFDAPIDAIEVDGAILGTAPGVYYKVTEIRDEDDGE